MELLPISINADLMPLLVEFINREAQVKPQSIKHALPEFKGHINHSKTAYYRPSCLRQEIEIKTASRKFRKAKGI